MIIAIRDDDTCYFTKPQQLQFVYGPYWDVCPITLSVIPFADARIKSQEALVPSEYYGIAKQYPIDTNDELTAFLKDQLERKRIGISMHGYSHFMENGKPEFKSGHDFSAKVLHGKKCLEKLFGCQITVFTAPNNSMSRRGAKAVIDAGMNIVMAYGFNPWERPVNYKTVKSFVCLLIHYLKYKRNYPYPGVLDCGTHKEHACVLISIKSRFEQLKECFDFLRNKNANMCIATHYAGMYCMPEPRKAFCKFMDYVLSNYGQEIQFATADKLFEAQNHK